MSKLNYPESSGEWAQRRGIAKRCPHGWHDPNIACPECKREEERRERERKGREEKKRRLKEAFDRIIWPGK